MGSDFSGLRIKVFTVQAHNTCTTPDRPRWAANICMAGCHHRASSLHLRNLSLRQLSAGKMHLVLNRATSRLSKLLSRDIVTHYLSNVLNLNLQSHNLYLLK